MKAPLFPAITRWRLACMLAAVVLVLGLSVPAALAVHDLGLFELEGNAVDDTSVDGDDWNQIYCDDIDPDRTGTCGPAGVGVLFNVAPSNALVSTFVFDPFNDSVNDDIFTQGGSKDSRDISAWLWTFGSPTDKSDIEHAYAAAYKNTNGDLIIYFGMDRLANNGDAALGFWFTQDEVAQQPASTATKPFSGLHRDGDVLVQTDWPQAAGAVPRIQAYVWDSACIGNNQDNTCVAPAQGGLRRTVPGATCTSVGSGDNLCAIANTGGEAAPWTYYYKDQGGVVQSSTFPEETLFEGGINLSYMFPGGVPCISTFIAETRVSNSETAQLDDKLVAKFDLCSISVIKEGPDLTKKGDTAKYKITITNNGALPLNKVSIIDDKLGTLTNECGATLNPGESCVITKDYVVPNDASDPLKNTVTATYMRDTATIDTTVIGTASHTADLFQPSITFDKKAEGSNGPLTVLQGATVDYTLTLNNTSSTDTPALDCTITDTQLGVSQSVTLTSGQYTTVNASKTFTTTATPFVNTANVSCSPQGFTNTLTASDSVTVNVVPSDQALAVSKTGPQYAKVGDSVTYTITIDNISTVDVTVTSISDTLLGDLLATAKTACGDPLVLTAGSYCEFTYARTVLESDPDPVVNTVTVQGEGPFGGQAGPVSDDHSVDLVHPSYTVTKDCLTDPVPQGQSANFRIRITNTGDVNLLIDVTDTVLGISQTDVVLGARTAACVEADYANASGTADASDGCYQIEAGVIATGSSVSNTVDVHATLPEQYNLSNAIDHSASDTCQVTGGATRTWGFWKTHGSDGQKFSEPVEYGYTCHVFEDHLGSSVNLGWKGLTTCAEVFGLFWADPATDPGKIGAKKKDTSRDQTCKTALHTSQQLLAAILNQALTNGSPIPGTLQADTVAALAACADNNSATPCDRNLLVNLAGQLAAYNQSGDMVAITDEHGVMIPHADPRGTRDAANYSISSCPMP